MLGTLGAVLSGLGGLSGLLGSLGLGKKKLDFENLNPYTDDTMREFKSALGTSDNAMNRYSTASEGSANRLSGIESILGNLAERINSIASPGVNAGYNLFNQRSGNLLDLGEQAARRFTSPFNEIGRDIADRRASEAAQNMMAQFGGSGYSGAAQSAASTAASDVMSDYEKELAGMYGNIGANISGNALNQERGLAEQAPQTQYSNTINSILQQAQLAQSRGGLLAQQGGLFGNLANQYGVRSNNLMSNIGALSSPQFQEPVYTSPLNSLGQGLSGMGNMFANPDFQNLFDGTNVGTPSFVNQPLNLQGMLQAPAQTGFINPDPYGSPFKNIFSTPDFNYGG